MAVRGGVEHGKSWPPMARGCFLLALMLLLLLLDDAHALAARHPALALGNNNNSSKSVKFRGSRSALMHPTAIVFSPPNKNPETQQQPLEHLGSSSSSFMPPGMVSSAPSTRAHLNQYSRAMPSLATPAVTPGPFTRRPHTWGAGGGGYPPQPTVLGFGLDRRTHLRPASAKWGRPRTHTFMEGGGGWAGMNPPAGQTGWSSLPRPQHTPETPDSASPFGRHDTFGQPLSEDLSHLHDRPTGWRQKITEAESPVGGPGKGGRRGTGPVFSGGPHQTNLWPMEKEVEDEGEVDDEGGRNMFDSNATSEYQPDDYNTYHEYDHSNTSWRPSEHTPSPAQDQRILTFQHVMEIQNIASQADLYTLLDQRGITFDELRDYLNSGARKKDVLEFLKAPTPSTTIITTTTSPPVLSHPPSEHDTSVVEEGYQDDVTRQVSLPESKDDDTDLESKDDDTDLESKDDDTDLESKDDDTDLESKEQSRKNRKKGRGRGKGGRRKNRKRKGKGQREGASDTQVNDTTQTPAPDPWLPSTPRLPEITTSTTDATRGILLPTTHPPTPDTVATSPSSVKTSDVSIVSVTLEEAPSDPQPEAPDQTTFLEGATPPRRQNTHSTTNFGEEQNPRKIPRPVRPSPEPEQTINELEKVNSMREKQRDDYVFPLRGLLIISGLMGALAVFTLVVLISYAFIKCSKKPVVNNYQVSEQQKPTGT